MPCSGLINRCVVRLNVVQGKEREAYMEDVSEGERTDITRRERTTCDMHLGNKRAGGVSSPSVSILLAL